MSIKRNHEFKCPACGHEQLTLVWSVAYSTDSMAMERIMSQRLNTTACGQCGEAWIMDEPVLFEHRERKYCIQYLNKDTVANKAYYEDVTKKGLAILDPLSARIVREKGDLHAFTPHYVFSMREMAAYIVFRDLCAAWGVD